MTPNPIKNPIEPPPLIPLPGAAVRPDILTWLAMQDRAWLLDNSLDNGKWEPLMDLPAKMQRFLAGGIRVEEPDRTGGTALFNAIKPNNVDVVQLLLRSGAFPAQTACYPPTSPGTTPTKKSPPSLTAVCPTPGRRLTEQKGPLHSGPPLSLPDAAARASQKSRRTQL